MTVKIQYRELQRIPAKALEALISDSIYVTVDGEVRFEIKRVED